MVKAAVVLSVLILGGAGSQGKAVVDSRGASASVTHTRTLVQTGLGETRSDPRMSDCQSATACLFWKRHAGYYRRKMVQWRRYAQRLQARTRSHWSRGNSGPTSSPAQIICQVFGSECRKAQAVAWCESRYDVHAANGQYLGLFQMGSAERARFGFAWNASTQARAALAYYRLAGWQPWSCA